MVMKRVYLAALIFALFAIGSAAQNAPPAFYAESFRSADHLRQIQRDAQSAIAQAFKN